MRISDWSSDVCSSDLLADSILVKPPDLFCHSGFPLTLCKGALHPGVARACGWHPAMKLACPSWSVIAKTRGDRKRDVTGQSVYVRVVFGGCRIINTRTQA